MLKIFTLGFFAILFLLSGCSTAFQATGETIAYAINPDRRVKSAILDPRFEYLRVSAQGRLAMLAQGATDRRDGQDLQVFFSADGEVVKLLNGRIVEFSSRQRHISVMHPAGLPPWDSAAMVEFLVETDARPEYVFSNRKTVLRRPLLKPPGNLRLEKINPFSLQWFEETVQAPAANQRKSIYGVLLTADRPQVVYSEQCIAVDMCLTLQRWRASGSY